MLNHQYKTFQTNDSVSFPSEIKHYLIDGKNLYLAPKIPSWLILNDIESNIFKFLQSGLTLKKAMQTCLEIEKMDYNTIISTTSNLLEKIENKKFYIESEYNNTNNNSKKKAIHLYLTHRCNLKCIHCYMNAGEKLKTELGIAEWKLIIDNITEKLGPTGITLSGGEPLLFKDIIELFQYITNKGHTIMLLTNGTLINNQDIANKIAKYVNSIQISIDGASADANDKIRGKGSFKKIVDAIKYLIDKEIRIDLAIQALPINIDDLEENLCNLLESLEYKKFQVTINYKLINQGRAKLLPQSYFDFENIGKKRIAYLLHKLEKSGNHIIPYDQYFENNRDKNCGIGGGFSIDSNGNIYPCPEIYYKIGNFFKDGFESLLDKLTELDINTSVDKIEICNTCDLKLICKGGCRLDNHRKYGNMLIPICSKKKKSKILYELANIYNR